MDRRDQKHKSFESFDEKRMVITTYDDKEYSAKWEVCDVCEGHGSHVNPSIDAHGISREEFDEDPDFAENYLSGRYDVPCAQCHGRRVTPVLDADRCTPDEVNRVMCIIEEYYAYQREEDMERRMGA